MACDKQVNAVNTLLSVMWNRTVQNEEGSVISSSRPQNLTFVLG